MGKNEIIFILMLVLIIAVLVGAYFFIPMLVGDTDIPSSLGLFGDQFGAVNALFSGLAFAGLIYTILLQKEELKAQREELRYTREEIEGQKLELKQQNETLALQRFENTFFSMLSQHNEIVANSVIEKIRGKSIIRKIVNGDFDMGKTLFVLWKLLKDDKVTFDQKTELIDMNYEDVYKSYSSFLGLYFRSLYRVFVYIDNSTIENKELYADIVRSQLSDDEIALLFINGLSNRGKKFKIYIEKYALLNNVPSDKVTPDTKKMYSSAAYGE